MTLKNLLVFAFVLAVCQGLVSKMNICPIITSEWSHIFIIAIMTAKLENCFILFIHKNVLNSSSFLLTVTLKNSKTVLKLRKNTDFFCLVIYLKETEPRLCSVACQSSYYLGKDGNMEKKYLLWEPILRHLLYLHRHWG